MASITIEASKVARKSPIRVDSSLVGTVSGVEDERFPTIVESSFECRLSVGQTVRVTSNFLTRHCYSILLEAVTPLVAVLSTIILLFSLPFLKFVG